MNKTLALLALLASGAQADTTYIQENLPGAAGISSGRGYIVQETIPGFTTVTPTRSGVVDSSRPSYTVGPSLPSLADPIEPRRRITPRASYDRFD